MTTRQLIVVAALALVACNSGKEASETMQSPPMQKKMAIAVPAPVAQDAENMEMAAQATGIVGNRRAGDIASTAAAATQTEIPASMLIRTGAASIEVSKLDPAVDKVKQMATQLGGYVANSSFAGGNEQVRTATLELKIPAQRYDQAIGGLGSLGKVESVNTSVEDVGEEYVDITARVANAKRLEERLVNLLATRTGKLEDVLAVERELARVREEIERYEGRMRFLRTRAAMSTLSITVHERAPILGQNPGDHPLVGAIKQAWRNFVGFIAWLIASLGVLIPAGVILALGWYAYSRFRRG